MLTLSRALTGALALFALLLAMPAAAQEKTGRKPGFTLAPGSATIVLIRPSIKVGAQSTGGMFEPNAEWTDQARANLAAAIAEVQGRLGNKVVDYVEPAGGEGLRRITEYRALFGTVAESVIEYQFFVGNRLPTKKRKDSFEWSLGPDVGKIPGLEGADYALFVLTRDQFGSTGRKVAQIFAALALGGGGQVGRACRLCRAGRSQDRRPRLAQRRSPDGRRRAHPRWRA